MKTPKIIYFIDGPVPTPADKAEANALRGKGVSVVFRNARYVEVESGVGEPADAVTGAAVPLAYKDFKSAEEVVAAFHAALAAEQAAVHPLSDQLATGGAAGAPATKPATPTVPVTDPNKPAGNFTAPGTFTAPAQQ
jgi:hypothetical protein